MVLTYLKDLAFQEGWICIGKERVPIMPVVCPALSAISGINRARVPFAADKTKAHGGPCSELKSLSLLSTLASVMRSEWLPGPPISKPEQQTILHRVR